MFQMQANWNQARAAYEIGRFVQRAQKYADPMSMISGILKVAVDRNILDTGDDGWIVISDDDAWPLDGYRFVEKEDAWMFWVGFEGDANGKVSSEIGIPEMTDRIFNDGDGSYELFDALDEICEEEEKAIETRPNLRVIQGGAGS